MDEIVNSIILKGQALDAPVFSHENHGKSYYIFPLRVSRLSGVWDYINIAAPAGLLAAFSPQEGDFVCVTGQVRSYNNKDPQGRRLIITALASALVQLEQEDYENTVLLSGALCRTPTFRRTPLGREICDLMLAVNRPYGKADYLPCIAWGRQARVCAQLEVGAQLSLRGRLQSRVYIKTQDGVSDERTAFEISAVELTPR